MDVNKYYSELCEAVSNKRPLWQATIVDTDGSSPAKAGMKMLIRGDGTYLGNLGGGEMEYLIITRIRQEKPTQPELHTFILSGDGAEAFALAETRTSMICGGKVTVFIEALHSAKLLQIIGAGHCGQALAHLAELCGFAVRLYDNRPEILAAVPPEILAERIFSDYTDLDEKLQFGPESMVVIMTHGHAHDQHVLEKCLGQDCQYLGMIGSKSKVSETLTKLRQKGYPEEQISLVRAPVGLPIGSQTPYEIAVSIMAEIVSLARHKTLD